jgi:uncharacterized protein (DUF849 family)
MHAKVVVTCAVTGNQTTPDQTPHLPITPQQIAQAAIDAAKAGAAVAHIHVRDPATGRPSMELGLYAEVMDRIRSSGTDVVINLTTGPGGRYVPDTTDPQKAAPASMLLHPDRRTEHIVALRPEIATLDLNTMWFGQAAVINAPWSIRRMAERIYGAGVVPELELFDSGDVRLAHALLADGTLASPPLVQLCMGIPYGFPADTAALMYARNMLPADAVWAAFGVSRMQLPMVAQAWILGGHVRVGLEDNIYLRKGELAPSNAALVERAVAILRAMNAEPATPAEVRTMLAGIGRKTPAAAA